MQKLELPEALNDIRRKIAVLERRLAHIDEGIDLYQKAAADETDPLTKYKLEEQVLKKEEERIVYDEQVRSQKVYLSEFENDLKQQHEMRRKQLAQIDEHLQAVLSSAKSILARNKDIGQQDRTLMQSLRKGFIKKEYTVDDERITRFRELLDLVNKHNRTKAEA